MSELRKIKLKNSNGLELEVLNYGAMILSLKMPDRDNKTVNVILGLENHTHYTSENYLKRGLYLGSTIGRYAGRISKGGFIIDKKEYALYTKDGVHLHGGKDGFNKQFWSIDNIVEGKNPSVTLSYYSKHLEEGYPGNLKVTATYQLKEDNTLNITYIATTDRVTHVNLTNHAYFNLNGKGSILDHELQLNSRKYLEVDNQLIPTGIIKNTKDTPYNFTEIAEIGQTDFQGLDDIFVLNEELVKASIYAKETGILMKVKTNQPAMVVYTPKNINGLVFKDNATYNSYPAICFETQKFPDTPNHKHFPSTKLLPNTTYVNESSFEFYII